MESKLELKHFAGYLPYGLKVQYISAEGWEDDGFTCRYKTEIEKIDGVRNGWILYLGCGGSEFKDIKPILRPLSDLTKEIEVNGEKFVPIVKLSPYGYKKGTLFYRYEHKKYYTKLKLKNSNEYVCHTIPSDINSVDYFTIQKLHEWHFDIHGLIDTS